MFNNNAKCFINDIFLKTFFLKDIPSTKQQINDSLQKRNMINPNLFKSEDFILEEEKYEDLFLHKVKLY